MVRLSEIVRNMPSKDEGTSPVSLQQEFQKKKPSSSGIISMPPALKTLYLRACGFVEGMMAFAQGKGEAQSMDEGIQISMEIVRGFTEPEVMQYRDLNLPSTRIDYVVHSVKISIFALQLGVGIGYPAIKLEELVLAGLMNNLGMVLLPEGICSKTGKLTEKEFKEVQKHSEYGYRFILDKFGDRCRSLAEVVYQVHERMEGQGYPRGLKGSEIHEFAKIIGLVDIYLALIEKRPQRKQFHRFEAIKQIIDLKKGFFPAPLIKILLRQLSVFPLLSLVRLNSGAVGKVIETSRELPLRPTVEIIYDTHGQMVLKKKIIKLSDSPLLYINDLVHEEEILSTVKGEEGPQEGEKDEKA